MKTDDKTVRKRNGSYELESNNNWIKITVVGEAASILGRSRRQVYRLLENGCLEHYGKFLGDWLISEQSVQLLQANPKLVNSLPKSMQFLYPEFDIKTLNLLRDRIIVVTRILGQGSIKDLRWLFSTYSEPLLMEIVAKHGSRLLSKRSWNFWRLYFFVSDDRSSWRLQNSPWRKRDEVA